VAPPGVKYVVNLACSRSSPPERIILDQATRRVRIREQAATDSRALIKSAVRHCQRSQVLIEYSGDPLGTLPRASYGSVLGPEKCCRIP
jgi:hypothetical protein